MLRNKSIPVDTIDGVEFIELEDSDFSPLVSRCQVKVLYVGKNRNNSYIDKNTAIEMAKSLRGVPIVGAWRKDIEDFGDHGHVITIEDGEVKFACKTVPYGFVAPDARVWFQNFTDTDEFGNEVEREYMLTTGYLWTGQFEEAKKAISEGQPQSMELDDDSLNGHWATDSNSGMDFFIINDALFSKLCILGDDVEPCFEGASVTGVEGNFAENAEFAHTLYSMIKELRDAIGKGEGGLNMPKDHEDEFVANNSAAEPETVEEVEVETEVEETTVEEPAAEVVEQEDASEEETSEDVAEDDVQDDDSAADDDASAEFVADDTRKRNEDSSPAQEENDDDPDKDDDEEDVTESACGDRKRRYSLEEENAILAELEELREFKRNIENREKDALIAKYHMLSDEDKADIVAHKEEYTLEQIDEKLALVYVRKNVDFDTLDGHPEEESAENTSGLLTFSLDDSEFSNNTEAVDEVQRALREMKSGNC